MIVESKGENLPVAFYDYLKDAGWSKDLILGFLGTHLKDKLPLLVIKDLSVKQANQTILTKVNLDVMPGEVMGILGLSGSGKSTLLHTLSGMMKPSYGTLSLKNAKSQYINLVSHPQKRASALGFAMQSPSIYPELTVKENLMHFAKLYGIDKSNAQIHTQNILEISGLISAQNQSAQSLSQGKQKLLDICLALIHGPQVLLLDDPMQGLDPLEQEQVKRLIRVMNKKGITVIVTASSIGQLHGVAHRIAQLENGKLYTPQLPIHQNNYQVAVGLADQDYTSLTQHLDYLGAKNVRAFQGVLMAQTEHPELIIKEISKHVLDHNKQITQLWCDKGELPHGAQ